MQYIIISKFFFPLSAFPPIIFKLAGHIEKCKIPTLTIYNNSSSAENECNPKEDG